MEQADRSSRPMLILVGGAPASGKSTLAACLARELDLPFIAKDAIKEVLCDVLGAPTPERSEALSAASYALIYAALGWLIEGGAGAVVDCNFQHGRAEDALSPLVPRSCMVLLHCAATRAEIIRRYEERIATSARHPGHHDATALPRVTASLDAGVYTPLELPIPTLRIETTRGYTPSLADISAFVRQATLGSRQV